MDFTQHVFISYAHIDNEPLSPQQLGWVTRFHATLEALLSMRLGRKARIWRDDKLRGNDAFADEIVEQFGHTALLVTVLTPRYVESEWCTRELSEFCSQAQRAGGLALNNRSRVFKVLKTPLESETPLPVEIRDVLGYAFFVVEDGTPLELDVAYGERYGQDYNRMVGKLAWDAAQLLRQLDGVPDTASRPVAASTVYLAECSHDRQPMRERIEAELKRLGCTVLPDRRLPLEDEAACAALIGDALARSALAVHLIGSTAGAVPDGASGESIVAMQNRLAAARCRVGGLQRLLWLPAGTRSVLPAQQAFIDALQHDPEAQFGADLLTGGIEAVLQAIHVALERLQRAALAAPAGAAPAAGPRPSSLYLICVEQDRKATVALRRWLGEAGIEVQLPVFEGDAATVRESNRQLLADCAAVLVFYGAGDEAWRRSVDSELKRVHALAGQRTAVPVFTYLAEPRSRDKDDLVDMQTARLIDGLAGWPEAALAELLAALQAARADA